ncbi:hypothetical protein [Fibrobacter sp. UWEL]|uniref:hypothetical protein n=1 Tax=Fibrobacter sp. UWEL TaxID=1896209 RepID=UPI0009132B83|nr:hypothetical protein [Fibrobacter sp. UWEL]SHL31136.1 hypothetical protein SAMN05720468_12153 [Fibrobacter sp. UWEL]
MKRIILSAMTVGVLAVGANALDQDENGCYKIGTSDDLFAFAAKVNANENPEKDACGILTTDITVNENVLTDYALNGTPAKVWTPIAYYHGVFDGQNHSISGLYATGEQEVGFFGALANGDAEVRNLNIKDSYFAVDKYMAGGIAGNIWASKSVIDNCSFDGVVTMTGNGVFTNDGKSEQVTYGNVIAGLVGNVSTNAKLVVSNSSNKGKIGYESDGYKVGAAVGLAVGAGSVDGKSTPGAKVALINFSNTGSFVGVEGSFIGGADEGSKTFEYSGTLSGTSLSFQNDKLVAVLDDSKDLSISADFEVDSVYLNRTFTTDAYSTIMLPFDIAASKIAGTVAEFTSVNAEYTVVTGTTVSSITAYKPYLLTANSAAIEIVGPVTIKASTSVNTESTYENWKFVGTLAKKRWQNVCTAAGSVCENAAEIGKVYGFSGTAVSGIDVGNFVKVGNKVSIRPMRAYLMYEAPAAQGKPAAPGMAMAAAVESVPTVILPDTMKVIIVDPVTEDPEEDVPTEGPLALDPIKAPAAAFKADRWYDITGRNLNKPKAQGAYINNRTTVIAK